MKKSRAPRSPRSTSGQPHRRPRNPGAGWSRRERPAAKVAADQPLAQPEQPLIIDGLTHDGRGIGRLEGKACFVRGALPGEQVTWRREASHRNFDEGVAVDIAVDSEQRKEPGCRYYPRCGGCSLRHLDAAAALDYKQENLARDIRRAGLDVEAWLPPLQGGSDGYRRRARLAVQKTRDGRYELGFRNAASRRIEPIATCAVLTPLLSRLLGSLPELLAAQPLLISEVELTEVSGSNPTLLVALTAAPEQRLNDSGRARLLRAAAVSAAALELRTEQLQLWWREADQRDFSPLQDLPEVAFELPGSVRLAALPGQFLQVNEAVNRGMIEQVLALANGGELAVDLFAGSGNFALPLAARYSRVIAVEGLQGLVDAGVANTVKNGLNNIEFACADLSQPLPVRLLDAPRRDRVDLVVIDPPRTGAAAAMEWIAKTGARQIVYISCHPATLLRDAKTLLAAGYRWRRAAALDMFPQTAHLEALALFEKD